MQSIASELDATKSSVQRALNKFKIGRRGRENRGSPNEP